MCRRGRQTDREDLQEKRCVCFTQHCGWAIDSLNVCRVQDDCVRIQMSGHVCGITHLCMGQKYRPGENDPFHHLAAGRRGQRAGISVITVHWWRQQIPQGEWLEVGLLFCVKQGIKSCQYWNELKHVFYIATKMSYFSQVIALLITLHLLISTCTNICKIVPMDCPWGGAFMTHPFRESCWWQTLWFQSKATGMGGSSFT